MLDVEGIPQGISEWILARKRFYTPKKWKALIRAVRTSTTLYVGNLSFYTTETQIYELFSRTGSVKRVIMGLNRHTKTPCGFCFVEYFNHDDAAAAKKFISGTKLDGRIILVNTFSHGETKTREKERYICIYIERERERRRSRGEEEENKRRFRRRHSRWHIVHLLFSHLTENSTVYT